MTTNQTILVVDVGNTSTVLGLYRKQKIVQSLRICSSSNRAGMGSALTALKSSCSVHGAVLCSVVPEKDVRWTRCIETNLKISPLHVHHALNVGVPISYPKPKTIGQDRLANVCGAVHRYGTPVVVADFGTALTFDIISRYKGYVGGIIAPGLPLMFSYLPDKTSLLPEIKPGPIKHAIGKSTEEAMRLGTRYGYRGMVREIVQHIKKNLGKKPFTFCATGGYASWVLRGIGAPLKYDSDLTLYGLGKLFELNVS
ncbi:MAG: type III pantothenate kinase [Kiritimatiellae bacterium]|nr:type III pantothenate kinase [Kiritimatiellia bacterium]